MNSSVFSVFFARPHEMNVSVTTKVLLVVVGSILIALSSKIQVPFHPVPMTLQTLVVLLIGLTYGRNLAAATLLLYLMQGAMGLPVFAGTPQKGLGIAYMFGSTGGYLFGFLIAASFVGWLRDLGWSRSFIKTVAAFVAGTIVIYAFGLIWLGTILGFNLQVFQLGLAPFVLGELTKIAIGSCLVHALWRAQSSNKHAGKRESDL